MKLIHKAVAYTAPALFLIVLHSPAEAAKGNTIREKIACVRDVTMVKTCTANAK